MSRIIFFKELRDYVLITIAMLSYCIVWTLFLLPNNITAGGVPGISSIIYWGVGIPVNVTYFLINAVLMIMALRILGLQFCIKTIYGIVVLTLSISIVGNAAEQMKLLHDQPFMASILGAVFCGYSVGLGM